MSNFPDSRPLPTLSFRMGREISRPSGPLKRELWPRGDLPLMGILSTGPPLLESPVVPEGQLRITFMVSLHLDIKAFSWWYRTFLDHLVSTLPTDGAKCFSVFWMSCGRVTMPSMIRSEGQHLQNNEAPGNRSFASDDQVRGGRDRKILKP